MQNTADNETHSKVSSSKIKTYSSFKRKTLSCKSIMCLWTSQALLHQNLRFLLPNQWNNCFCFIFCFFFKALGTNCLVATTQHFSNHTWKILKRFSPTLANNYSHFAPATINKKFFSQKVIIFHILIKMEWNFIYDTWIENINSLYSEPVDNSLVE